MSDDSKRIPFSHMIYFGDGATDIPCMKLLKGQGGYAIAIYEKQNTKQVENAVDLVKRGIINFACNADYRKGEEIYNKIKAILQQIKLIDNYHVGMKDFESLQRENHEKTKEILTVTPPISQVPTSNPSALRKVRRCRIKK